MVREGGSCCCVEGSENVAWAHSLASSADAACVGDGCEDQPWSLGMSGGLGYLGRSWSG